MTTLPVNTESVIERIQAMRISAEGALGSVQASLAKSAEPLARVVAAYRELVGKTGSRIIQAQVKVIQARSKNPTDPTLIAMERRTVELLTAWTAHARGYTAYERPATEAEKGGAIAIGVAPVVIIAIAVAGAVIAVSVTGIAWAVVHYKEATILSDEVAIIEQNPALADALAKLNETAPSSAPPDPTNPDSGGGFGWFLAAAGLAAAAIFIVPKLGKG
jgi:hypothetical protein